MSVNEQVGPVGMEAPAGEVVEPEAKLGLLDPVFHVGLGPLPGLERIRRAFLVVGDQHPVVPLPTFQCQLLVGLDGIAADDEAPRALPGLGLPANARHLAPIPVAGGLPVGLGDRLDAGANGGNQRCADGVGDLVVLTGGEEVLAVEALVGPQEAPAVLGEPSQALGEEPASAARGGRRGRFGAFR